MMSLSPILTNQEIDMSCPIFNTDLNKNTSTSQSSLYIHHYTMAVSFVSMTINIIIGIPANLLVLVAIRRYRVLRTSVNALIFNLAVADLISCTLTSPVLVILLHTRQRYSRPLAVCLILDFVNTLTIITQLITILCISIERYQAVATPFDKEKRLLRVKFGIPFSWMCGFACAITAILAFDYGPVTVLCTSGCLLTTNLFYYEFGIYILVPIGYLFVLGTIVFYARIIALVKAHIRSFNESLRRKGLHNKINPTAVDGTTVVNDALLLSPVLTPLSPVRLSPQALPANTQLDLSALMTPRHDLVSLTAETALPGVCLPTYQQHTLRAAQNSRNAVPSWHEESAETNPQDAVVELPGELTSISTQSIPAVVIIPALPITPEIEMFTDTVLAESLGSELRTDGYSTLHQPQVSAPVEVSLLKSCGQGGDSNLQDNLRCSSPSQHHISAPCDDKDVHEDSPFCELRIRSITGLPDTPLTYLQDDHCQRDCHGGNCLNELEISSISNTNSIHSEPSRRASSVERRPSTQYSRHTSAWQRRESTPLPSSVSAHIPESKIGWPPPGMVPRHFYPTQNHPKPLYEADQNEMPDTTDIEFLDTQVGDRLQGDFRTPVHRTDSNSTCNSETKADRTKLIKKISTVNVCGMDGQITEAQTVNEQVQGDICLMTPKNRERGKRRVEAKTAKKVSLVIGVYLVCLLPFPIVITLCACLNLKDANVLQVMAEVYFTTMDIALLATAINPIMYAATNQQFRQEYKKMFLQLKKQCGRH